MATNIRDLWHVSTICPSSKTNFQYEVYQSYDHWVFRAPCAGLDRNGYDKSKCEEEFESYKQCKKHEVHDLAQPAWDLLPLSFLCTETPSLTPPAFITS